MPEKRADGTDLDQCMGEGVANIYTPRKSDGHWGTILCRTTACQNFLTTLLSDDKNFYCAPEVVAQDTGFESGASAEEIAEYDLTMEQIYQAAKQKYNDIKDVCSLKSNCDTKDTMNNEPWFDAYKNFGNECSELCGAGQQGCEPYGNKCRSDDCRKKLAWLDVGRTAKCSPDYTSGEMVEADAESKWENIRSICTDKKDLTKDQINKPVRNDSSSPKLYSLAGTLAGLAFSGLCILLA